MNIWHVKHRLIAGSWHLEHLEAFARRWIAMTSSILRIKWLLAIPETSSPGFSINTDRHVGQLNSPITLPTAFSRWLLTNFSKQLLQNEWKQGKVLGSVSVSRHIEHVSILCSWSTGTASVVAAAIVGNGQMVSQTLLIFLRWSYKSSYYNCGTLKLAASQCLTHKILLEYIKHHVSEREIKFLSSEMLCHRVIIVCEPR